MAEPASIRYKNPGAMWGSALAKKWGSTATVKLNDGLGQGNNIAVFPTYVAGICAQLDLWRSSKNYRNKTLAAALHTWSGGNWTESYIKFVLARCPGMTRNTIMNDDLWRSPSGIDFLKAQAWHEAGKPYPAPLKDWIEARRRVFGNEQPKPVPKPKPKPDPEDKPWYQRGFIGWLLGILGGGFAGTSFTITDHLIYSVSVLIAVAMIALAFWVYVIPPRGSFKVRLPWDG